MDLMKDMYGLERVPEAEVAAYATAYSMKPPPAGFAWLRIKSPESRLAKFAPSGFDKELLPLFSAASVMKFLQDHILTQTENMVHGERIKSVDVHGPCIQVTVSKQGSTEVWYTFDSIISFGLT